MFVFIPYEIETLKERYPWANWLLVGICSLVSLIAIFSGGLYNGDFDAFILDGFSLPGFFGHILLHGGLMHLIGNMIFLWVFGNAICMNVGNLVYMAIFLACTMFAAVAHIVFDGGLAIGASGAINGIVGVTLAMYPLNRVYLFWIFFIKGGSTSCKAYLIILAWFLFDIWGVISGGGMIAYWAHIGGFLGGLAIGLVSLHLGWIMTTEYDNRTLLEIFKGENRD